MYEYFCALIIGIVEGLTEYIPVSSTGHMIIVGNMINFTGELANVFDVFIQLGAILSVVVVYRQKFLYIKTYLSSSCRILFFIYWIPIIGLEKKVHL